MADHPADPATPAAPLRAVLSIGGNVGDAAARLRGVDRAFGPAVVARSGFYATAPWGGVAQDDFLNAVLIVEVADSPRGLLRRCQDLERAADRVREVRWGPRTLDVDIIAARTPAGAVHANTPELTLPHPRAHLRAFVLVPWLEADPDARLAGAPVAGLLAGLDPAEVAGVRRLDLGWAGPGADPGGAGGGGRR